MELKIKYSEDYAAYLIYEAGEENTILTIYSYKKLLKSIGWIEIYKYFHVNYNCEIQFNTIIFDKESDANRALQWLKNAIIMEKLINV